MRLNLERLDARGFDLTFGADPEGKHRVTLGQAQGLRGTLVQAVSVLRLSDVLCEQLAVSLLELQFRSFSVGLHTAGTLGSVVGRYERRTDGTDLHLSARSLHAPDLSLDFEKFRLRGELVAENVQLDVTGSEGRVRAETLELVGLRFAGPAGMTVDRLTAHHVEVSWGAAGTTVRVADVHVSQAEGELELQPSSGRGGAAPLVPWEVLDGLSGSLDVDVHVDLKVPVIGGRRAMHPLRISIEEGTINYLALERNLSALEDSLLDFAVREESLVLERGIPLLPTRGRGQPLVRWPLDQRDLALTSQDRVRLAVLPHFRLETTQEDEPGEDGPRDAAVALRQLSFANVQALLRLDTIGAAETPLRDVSFQELRVQGSVHHLPDTEPREGEITAQLFDLRGLIEQLPLGTKHLDVGSFSLARIGDLRARFRGIRPHEITIDMADLRATSLCLGGPASRARAAGSGSP